MSRILNNSCYKYACKLLVLACLMEPEVTEGGYINQEAREKRLVYKIFADGKTMQILLI